MNEDFEQKIERALEGEKNELSSSLDALSKLLSKPWAKPSIEISFEELYEKANRSKIAYFSKPTIISLSAAALLLFSIASYFFLSKRQASSNLAGTEISITKIAGKAFLLSNDSDRSLALAEGESVSVGQILRTEKDSQIFLSISRGEGMILGGETELEVLKDGNKSFRLRQGDLLVHLHKNLKKEEFKILTSQGFVEVRGTKFEVRENRGEGTVVSVLEGRVATRSANEKDKGEQVLEPGQKIQLEPKGFHRSFLTGAELNQLGKRFTALAVEEIPRNTEKSFSNKDDLFTEYQRLERVLLASGEIYEGVIVDMDEKFMYLQTLKNEIKIPRDSVLEVIQLR